MRTRFWGKYCLVLPLLVLSGCALLDKSGPGESSDAATEQALQETVARPGTSAMVPETSTAGNDEPISNPDADVIRSVQAALNGRGFWGWSARWQNRRSDYPRNTAVQGRPANAGHRCDHVAFALGTGGTAALATGQDCFHCGTIAGKYKQLNAQATLRTCRKYNMV